MMIGNDGIDADTRGGCYGLVASGSAIDSDNQVELTRCDVPQDMFGSEAISFPGSVRKINGDIGLKRFQKIINHGGGRDTIHIVVSKYQDFSPVYKGTDDAVGGLCNILEGKRRPQVIQARGQEVFGIGRIGYAAIDQEQSHNRVDPQVPGHLFNEIRLGSVDFPQFIHAGPIPDIDHPHKGELRASGLEKGIEIKIRVMVASEIKRSLLIEKRSMAIAHQAS